MCVSVWHSWSKLFLIILYDITAYRGNRKKKNISSNSSRIYVCESNAGLVGHILLRIRCSPFLFRYRRGSTVVSVALLAHVCSHRHRHSHADIRNRKTKIIVCRCDRILPNMCARSVCTHRHTHTQMPYDERGLDNFRRSPSNSNSVGSRLPNRIDRISIVASFKRFFCGFFFVPCRVVPYRTERLCERNWKFFVAPPTLWLPSVGISVFKVRLIRTRERREG